MTALQESARKALACLELYDHEDLASCEARHELRTALAQQGEPVAWINSVYDIELNHKNWMDPDEWVPLYTAAPAPVAQHSQYGSEDLQALILAKLTAPQAQEPARNVTKEEDAILRGALLRSGTVIHPKPAPQPAQGVGRTNDPVTSKGKRKINKYEEEVLAQLSMIGPSTGKEIAALSQQPLNCITPHFATLRRKGLIKDIGVRRDKQIVWVLA